MKITIFRIAFILFFITAESQNKTITTSGDILATALPASALISTFIWNDDNSKPLIQFVLSHCSSIVIAHSLKHIVLKPRPDGSDNFSFPSGHTTSAFSGASFIQKRYGWKYGIPAYALASYVGYTRIQAKKHDTWDVLAGATIGIGTSYLFTKPYKKPINISIQKSDNGYLLNFNYTF